VTAGELTAVGVDYHRGGRQILQGVDVRARAGEVLAVTGPSGSGKSSLLAVLAGLEPAGGAVRLGGDAFSGDVAFRRRFGLVLQGYGLVSVLTATENVEVVLQARGVARDEVRARAAAALASVRLDGQGDQLVEELSGGQQQRVAVARAVVTGPDVLLADEPTAELDAEMRQVVLDLLFGAARRGAIVVIATHDTDVATACDRELRLVGGRPASHLPN
jgi:putative ABC transport system ATP-binding protein